MADTRELLERAAAAAPVSELDAVTLERRRAHRRRRERIAATVVGVGVGVALIVGAVTVAPGHGSLPRSGGAGLPPATTTPVAAATGEYYVQRVRETTTCATSSCPGGDVGVDLTATIWWATDGSGRIDAPRHQNYGITQGTFAPGSFPTEGDTGAFPTDPASLQTYLLDRSAPGGASPGPGEPTPTPGVDARTGDVWRSIENLLSDPAAYGDTTPALRAALVEVAARLPMATVDTTAVDPAGRPAIRIRVAAFQGVTDLFVDPGSHDLLAVVDTYDDGWVESYVVLRAGIADSTDAMPTADQSSIPAASGS